MVCVTISDGGYCMRVFKQFDYIITKKETPQVLLSNVKNALHDLEWAGGPIIFYLSNSAFRTGVSSVARAVKNIPILGKFEFKRPHVHGEVTLEYSVLSNLPSGWDEENTNEVYDSLDINTVEEIFNGIPRSYPFHEAVVVFDQINWMKCGIGPAIPLVQIPGKKPYVWLGGYLSPSIILKSNWWVNGRENSLLATIEVQPPEPSQEKLTELGKNVLDILNKLGKIKRTELVAVPDEAEAIFLHDVRNRAETVISTIKDNYNNIFSQVDLPYELPNPKSLNGTFDPLSPKTVINKYFKAEGYKDYSNKSVRGCYFLAKRTAMNNQICLQFDFAPMARMLSSTMQVKGPLWKWGITINFSPHCATQFPIDSEEILDKVIANAVKIVKYMEQTMVPRLEEIYGSAPKWYEYQQ